VLAGPGVTRRHRLTQPVSILDVPPTLCHWFRIPVPSDYEGRVVAEAFASGRPAAEVGA
jgi:arylsulfatase A-like enzyme